MSRSPLVSTLIAGVLLASAGGVVHAAEASSASSASTPTAAVQALLDAARGDDLQALVAGMMPPDRFAEMEAAWLERREQPVDPQQAAQLATTMSMLTAENAEETLFALVQPQLAQTQKQLTQAAAMLPMMAASAIPQDSLQADEQQELQAVIGKLGAWAQQLDLTDEAKVKEAIGIACATARELELPDLQAVNALDLAGLLGKGGIALGGVKDILAIYGLDVAATLESIELGEASVDGDTAVVPVSMTVLGAEVDADAELQRIDGTWYPAGSEEAVPLESAPPAQGGAAGAD